MSAEVSELPKVKDQKYAAIPTSANWKALAELGFERGEFLDCSLVKATLPSSWNVHCCPSVCGEGATAHVYDHRGLKRISVYYSEPSCNSGAFCIIKERFFRDYCFLDSGTVIASVFDAAKNNELVYKQTVGNFSKSKDSGQVGFLRVKTFAYYGSKWLGLRQGMRVVKVNRSDCELIAKKDFLDSFEKLGPQESLLDFIKTDARIIAEHWIRQNVKGDPWSERNDFPPVPNDPIWQSQVPIPPLRTHA